MRIHACLFRCSLAALGPSLAETPAFLATAPSFLALLVFSSDANQ
jgi:hypothetical protein